MVNDYAVINPLNEEGCATISLGSEADTDAAVSAAKAALPAWAATPVAERTPSVLGFALGPSVEELITSAGDRIEARKSMILARHLEDPILGLSEGA